MKIMDRAELQRFELPIDDRDVDGLIAFINYTRADRVLTLLYAEVPAHMQGRGIGSALVQGTLDLIRARGERIVPVCGYIRAWLRRHPDYHGLLAER